MKDIKIIIRIWNKLIDTEFEVLKDQLSDLDISALSACIVDCHESFHVIFFDLLDKINNTAPDDFDSIHDCVVDIYWHLRHIKNHITDAEKAFTVLMKLLAEKAESKRNERL